MSDHNGNGSNGDGTGNPVTNPDYGTMPGKNGGWLKRGGKNPGGGRPRSEVRAMLVDEFVAMLPGLKEDVATGKLTRKEFADLCGKYGLGTTITETDTDGKDVIRVVREPRRYLVSD